MIKRFSVGSLALGLFLTMAPVVAMGSEPSLTFPTGTVLETGQKLKAASVGSVSLTSTEGNITCPSATMTGSLTKNSGGAVEATIESASFNGGKHCESATEAVLSASPAKNGVPWCLRSTPELKSDEFQIRGGACGKSITPIRLSVNRMALARECVYESAEPIIGNYTTDPSVPVLSNAMTTFPKVAGHLLLCPGSLTFDSSFTLESESGSFAFAKGPSLTTLTAGAKIRGVGGGVTFTGVFGADFTCPESEFAGTLAKNSGSAVEVGIESASISGKATLNTCPWPGSLGNQRFTFGSATNGLPWCLQATSEMSADEYRIRGGACASEPRPIRFSYDTYEFVTCLYEREAALAGTYQTHPKDAVLQLENAVFSEVEKKAACPDQTQLDSSLTLEHDSEGKPVYIS